MPSCRASLTILQGRRTECRAVARKLWPDSLFTRMLQMQGVLVVVAVVLFWLVLVAERSVLMAKPYAVLWAPALRQAAALPIGSPRISTFGLVEGLRREVSPPPGFSLLASWAPGVRALRDALMPFGVTLGKVYVQWYGNGLVYTVQVQVDGGEPVWLSAAGNTMVPSWSIRMSVGLLAMLLLIFAFSRSFARRVTRPLARLHDHMVTSAQAGATLAPLAADDPLPPPPELQAMQRAYTDLADKLPRWPPKLPHLWPLKLLHLAGVN